MSLEILGKEGFWPCKQQKNYLYFYQNFETHNEKIHEMSGVWHLQLLLDT